MKVIIAGSRTITDYELVRLAICSSGFDISEVVSGCARGVDSLGEQYARGCKLLVTRFPANWEKYGKSAGFRRNVEMAEYADALIAVWDGASRGTKHMIDEATKRGLRVHIQYDGVKYLENLKTVVVNIRKDAYDVKICRRRDNSIPSAPAEGCFGNPFSVEQYGREKCIALYRDYFYKKLESDTAFRNAVHRLKGKRLACFCAPLACHGDIIKEYLDNARI